MKTRSTSQSAPDGPHRIAARAQGGVQLRQPGGGAMPDTRAASLAQLQHQQRASNSGQAAQLRACADLMAASGAQAPMQRTGEAQPLQGKFEALQETRGDGPVQRAERPNDTGLPNQLKAGIESLSGMRMDHVKVHYNSDRPAQFQAHAYAQGSEIHVAPGQEKHVPHEAWHVVQQAQGRVKPTMQMKAGVPVNDEASLEMEADVMGAKALSSGASLSPHGVIHAGTGVAQNGVRQRMVAVANGDMNAVTDPLILNNLDYAKSHFGAPLGDFVANRKFNQMGAQERIGIVEHGLPGQIGNYDAEGVADILTDPVNCIPKSTKSVVLYSCFAAADTDAGAKTSMVAGLSGELKKKGYEVGVEGQVGVGFGFAGIGERTTKGDFKTGVKAWVDATQALMGAGKKYAAWSDSSDDVSGLVGEPYAPLLKLKDTDVLLEQVAHFPLPEIAQMSLEQKAAHISKLLTPFWRDAEATMGSNLYAHLKGWLRVKTYANGEEFVQSSL
jgi:hypothetical protein